MKRLDVLGEKDDVVRGVGDSMPPTGLQKGMKLGLNNCRTSTEHQPHLKLIHGHLTRQIYIHYRPKIAVRGWLNKWCTILLLVLAVGFI